MQEPLGVPPNLDLITVEPRIERDELGRGPARREAGQVSVVAQADQSHLEQRVRELCSQAGGRGRSDQQPDPPASRDRDRDVMQAAEIDVAARDGEAVVTLYVIEQVCKRVGVAAVVAEVVEEKGTSSHGLSPALGVDR